MKATSNRIYFYNLTEEKWNFLPGSISFIGSIKMKLIVSISILVIASHLSFSQSRTISKDELRDKIAGYWIGQCVGNYMGFPFEGTYLENAVPVFVDRYYQFSDDSSLLINRNDMRGYCPLMVNWLEGAFSDDDTDIEFVTLFALEKYGLDISYEEITEMWKKHINRKIWCANRTARNLMEKGLFPPETGNKKYNENWYQIDPQLVNEIWGLVYPGMINKSAEWAEWGARITNDDWGTHPAVAYAIMYSAALFETNVEKLVKLAQQRLPKDSPFSEGVSDVLNWHNQNPDWRVTRKLIFNKYYRYKKNGYEAPVSDVNSLANGLFGIMAILYGGGDFVQTTGIAVSAGLDCDNQAATCAGLIGVMYGASAIPKRLTLGMYGKAVWEKAFNDTYINFTRDNLPAYNRISDIVERILALSETAIVSGGGKISIENGQTVYTIKSDLYDYNNLSNGNKN
jgi:ADP-ribosylglycohydrolase